MPVCRETEGLSATIPADGAWHTFSFDLNRLRTASGGAQSANDALQQVKEILFNFAGEQATLLLDDIRVLPEEKTDDDNSGNNGSDPGSGKPGPPAAVNTAAVPTAALPASSLVFSIGFWHCSVCEKNKPRRLSGGCTGNLRARRCIFVQNLQRTL